MVLYLGCIRLQRYKLEAFDWLIGIKVSLFSLVNKKFLEFVTLRHIRRAFFVSEYSRFMTVNYRENSNIILLIKCNYYLKNYYSFFEQE